MFVLDKPIKNLAELDDISVAIGNLRSDKIKTFPMLKSECSERASANVSQCLVFGPVYSFGIWLTKECISFQEYGWHTVPFKVFKLKDLEAIDVNNVGLTIYFKDPSKSAITLGIVDHTKTTKELIDMEYYERSLPQKTVA